MLVELSTILPSDFHPQSKVWIYQSNRIFSMSEVFQVESILEEFTHRWKSHGAPVKGFGTIIYGQFIVLMADESFATVGGCSTDSSVHVIKEIEQRFHVSMFDRTLLAFWVKNRVQTIPHTQVAYALENNLLTPDTLYFNNLVNNKASMEKEWLQPIKESWLATKYIPS